MLQLRFPRTRLTFSFFTTQPVQMALLKEILTGKLFVLIYCRLVPAAATRQRLRNSFSIADSTPLDCDLAMTF